MERTSIKSFFDRSYHRLFNGHRCYYSQKRKEKYNDILIDLDDYVYRALGDGWFLKSKCVIHDMSGGYKSLYKVLGGLKKENTAKSESDGFMTKFNNKQSNK